MDPSQPVITGKRVAAVTLVVAGCLLITDGVVTAVWQEPLSGLIAARAQHGLRQQLLHQEQPELGAPQPAGSPLSRHGVSLRSRVATMARRAYRNPRRGSAFGELIVPRLRLDRVVVFGSDEASLRKGPGLMMQSQLPGFGGTTVVAGHRTTYLAPFRNIDQLRRGSAITLKLAYGTFSYRVEGSRIVSPRAVRLLRPVDHERLMLSACHPLFSASHRIVVFARLVSTRLARARGAPTDDGP
jgi:sortase A